MNLSSTGKRKHGHVSEYHPIEVVIITTVHIRVYWLTWNSRNPAKLELDKIVIGIGSDKSDGDGGGDGDGDCTIMKTHVFPHSKHGAQDPATPSGTTQITTITENTMNERQRKDQTRGIHIFP